MLHKLWVRNLIIVGALILLVVMMLLFEKVVTPVAIALVIGYVGDPLIDKLEEWKISRTWGIVILIVVLSLGLGGIMIYVIPKLVSQISDLTANLSVYYERLENMLSVELKEYKAQHQEEYEQYKEAAMAWLQENAGVLARNVAGSLATSFQSVGNFIANILSLVIIPVLAFYFMRDFDILKYQALDLIPVKRKQYVLELFRELDQALGSFIKGQLLIATILSIIYTIGLAIAGCPAFLLIGLLAGFSNLIPYLGIAMGLVPAVLLTYLSGNPMWQVILSGATFLIGQMLEGMVITPKIMGDTVGMHPVVVMVALMIGGTYFGFVGMILALPVCAVAMVLMRRAYKYYVNSLLYHEGELSLDKADDPPQAPEGV